MNSGPKIYLNYVINDEKRAEELYAKLTEAGFRPWMCPRDVPPGADWMEHCYEAIRQADFFLPLLSDNWRLGHFEVTEAARALQIADERKGKTYFIPILLEPTEIPDNQGKYRAVKLYRRGGFKELVLAINRAIAPEPLPAPRPPEPLVRACADKECVLYVGAGLSAPMGLPLWGELVRKLMEWAESERLIEPYLIKSLDQSLESDADLVADLVFEAARSKNRLDGLIDTLKSMFVTPQPVPGPNHELLNRVGFAAGLTTNFDNLLEQAFGSSPVYVPGESESLLEALSRREFFLLKLFGTLNRPETVLVAPRQYEDEIVGNQAFSQFMESLFVSRTLFFVGASLAGIEAYLRGIRFRGTLSRKHYALVAVNGTAWRAKAEALQRRYQIEVLPYEVSPDHPEVGKFLKELGERVQQRTGGVLAAPGREQSWLRRIRLENIGPFTELELELDRHWNVLLGNNGVGKSSILRAVAAALCGRDAETHAERLIHYGSPSGKVILEASGENPDKMTEYVTELARTTGKPIINSLPGRLQETEGWLALGFPALRTVTWRRAGGPQVEEGRRRPNAEDLLPLVAADTDPRMESLKQWIVNLDYRIKDQANPHRDRYQQLLAEFFKAIRRLTGKLKIEFVRVDIDLGRVILNTDDGEVPLEAVSQGTVSLLAWVGVLMQRLYEVYDDNPLGRYALVLMDEIDAHMHPEWQQDLVPALTELFPHVQFLVTTHSPLIVSGMDVRQVVRFVRDDGKITRVELAPDSTMGRADQVLTGMGFGLETTVDKATREAIKTYQELLGKPKTSLTPEQQSELRRLEKTLAFRLPGPQEGPVERRAHELFKALLWSQMEDDPAGLRDDLLRKADQLFQAIQEPKGGRG